MTNIMKRPEKRDIKARLVKVAEDALKQQGWTVERIPGSGKSSLRRITQGNSKKKVSIRTTQDTWIAFPRSEDNKTWATLSEVDYVIAASVDDRHHPQFAQAHMIPASEVRSRFDRAYAARKKDGHVIPKGRGVWVSLYHKESTDPVSLIGAGMGLDYPAILRMPLSDAGSRSPPADRDSADAAAVAKEPFTIAKAKRELAASLGVAESAITITISG